MPRFRDKKKFCDSDSGSRNGWMEEGQELFSDLCDKIGEMRKHPETGRKLEEMMRDRFRNESSTDYTKKNKHGDANITSSSSTNCSGPKKKKKRNVYIDPAITASMNESLPIGELISRTYIKPNQQAIDAAVRAKHGSPSKIALRVPSHAPAPAPRTPSPAPAPGPASPVEESQAPAPFLDESPLLSIQHSFGDLSKDSVSSDFAAGALGLMTQQFEVPKKSPPPFPSNISLGTGEEPSPVPMPFTDRTNQWREHNSRRDYHNEPHCNKDRGQFAEDCPREPRYGHNDRSRLRYEHYNRYEPLYEGEPPLPPRTESYEPRYKEERKPRPRQDSHCVSFGENRSYYYEPRYEEERKPPPRQSYKPRYEEERKPPPRRSYEPRYEEERKPPPRQYEPRYEEERKPPPRQYEPRYEEERKPPPRQYEPRYEEKHPSHVLFLKTPAVSPLQNGAWGPSPVEVFSGYPPSIGRPSFASTDPEVQITEVHRPSAWEDVELPEWGSQIRW
eukprot:jgi/Psemu1/23437/gm1.23437_g